MKLRAIATAGLCCSIAWADFSYEQSSKITGGAMAGMMRVAGAFSKAAREPQKMTIMVKGDRMAMVSQNRVNIIDLNAETFSDVDLEKKTYATITFAQMAEAMRRMAEKMGQAKNDGSIQFKADVKNTGATRVIQGMNTKETILALAMEATDNKSGNTGAMNFTMDMWMAPDVPGYGEVRSFYEKMAQKMAWTPGAAFGPLMAQYGKGMSELSKEMAKLEGIPVLQITRIGGTGTGAGTPSEAELAQAQAQAQQAQQEQQQVQPAIVAEEAAGAAAASAATSRMGRLGGLAGGLGGFGRRKKNEAQQQAPPPAEQPQQAQTAPAQRQAGGSGALMELTTELTGFSSSVDASKFDVPAGFKQVEHDMVKALK